MLSVTTGWTKLRRSWRVIGLAIYIGLNVGLTLEGIRFSDQTIDWQLWSALPDAIARGNPYEAQGVAPFVWSPAAAWLMAGVSFVGYWPWVAAHVAIVLLLRDWRLIGLVLVSWGFWADASQGNVFVFVFIAAALALQGSRWWGVVYLALLFLMPRPVQIPIAVWLLLIRPDLRLPALAVFGVHAAIVLASGLTVEWVNAMLDYGQPPFNIGPSYFLGFWWLAIGIPVGVWLTIRGRVGWAGLVVSPYLLAQYLLFPIVDFILKPRDAADRTSADGNREPSSPRLEAPCREQAATEGQ